MEVVAGRLGKLWAATTDGPAPAVTMTKINFSIFKPQKKLIFNSLSWKYISDHQTLMCFEFIKQNLTNSAENVYSWRIEYFYIQKLSDQTREENWLLWLLEKSALQSLHSLCCFQNSAVLFQHFSCLFEYYLCKNSPLMLYNPLQILFFSNHSWCWLFDYWKSEITWSSAPSSCRE